MQRPLATVVIGGILSSTFLTLLKMIDPPVGIFPFAFEICESFFAVAHKPQGIRETPFRKRQADLQHSFRIVCSQQHCFCVPHAKSNVAQLNYLSNRLSGGAQSAKIRMVSVG